MARPDRDRLHRPTVELVLIGIGSIGLLWLVWWIIIAIVITILELLGWKPSKEGA